MVLWIGIAALLAIPVYPQGEAARSNAALARQAIRTGTVVLHERWESCWGVSECDATAYFDERRYRLDVHEHSGLGLISATNGRLIDPVRMAFDGEMILDRLVQGNQIATFSIRPEDDTSLPIHNARLLGLPGAPSPQISVEKRLRTEGRLVDASTRGSIHTLRILTPLPNGGSQRVDLSIDAEKGWSVIEYTMQDTPPTIPHFVCKGVVTPALFGDSWYPRYVKIEQWRDNQLDWTREYTVSDAQLNVELDPDTFTWDGLGIYDGAMINSRISRVPGYVHRTGKPSSEFSHQCPGNSSDKPK